MGFPLSTDIFGQLAWLVRQVKLLVFRVTRIEQSGTGGAQNINQVLNVGNTATNKEINLISTITGGSTFNGIFNPAYIQYTETFPDNTSITGFFGRSQIGLYNSQDNVRINIGSTEGYLSQIGFTVTNGAGSSISCDPTQYVITSSTAITNINASGFLITNAASTGQTFGLTTDFTSATPILKTTINGNDAGFYFQNNKTFTIGKEGTSEPYFGIKTDEGILFAGGIRESSTDYNTPSGFIKIRIDGTDYWLELWTV